MMDEKVFCRQTNTRMDICDCKVAWVSENIFMFKTSLPDATISAASVAEQCPGPGRRLMKDPVSSLSVSVQVV